MAASIYDSAANRWLPARGPAVLRVDHTATLLDGGLVLLAGGRSINAATLSGAELYDPAAFALDQSSYLPLVGLSYPPPPTFGPFPTPTPYVGPGVQIVDVVLKDPSFPDTSAEYVLLRNPSGSRVSLAGWRLVNASRPDANRAAAPAFVFPAYTLASDVTIVVFSQAGDNDLQLGDFFWNQQESVWRAGDRAELRDAQGALVAGFIVPGR